MNPFEHKAARFLFMVGMYPSEIGTRPPKERKRVVLSRAGPEAL